MGDKRVKVSPVVAERLTTTLVAFTVRKSAAEPEAMVRVVEGEVRMSGVDEVKVSGAAWAGRTDRQTIASTKRSIVRLRTPNHLVRFLISTAAHLCFWRTGQYIVVFVPHQFTVQTKS